MEPEFKIDEKVIIVDHFSNAFIVDFVIQIIIERDNIEYLFDNVSRPVSIHSKRLFKFSVQKEQELKNNGYTETINLI